MDIMRIGSKLISRARIDRRIDEAFEMRVAGKSQQETADALGVDRTFVSRLEALGEIRKGGRIALVGFPVENKLELERVASRFGVDFTLLFTDKERRDFAEKRSGADLVNEIMALGARLRSFDTVLFLGSDMRIKMVESMIGRERVIGILLGPSPLAKDVAVDLAEISNILESLRAGEGAGE